MCLCKGSSTVTSTMSITLRQRIYRHSEYRDKGEGQKAQSQLQMTRQNDVTVETDLGTFLSAIFS